MKDKAFNPAGKIAEIFVDSRLTILFIIGCSLLGVVAVLQTPREENPQIVVPAAEIVMVLPGASASEVEELVVTPLEGLVGEITGVDHTYATALNSVGIVMVRFDCGEDEEESESCSVYTNVARDGSRAAFDEGIRSVRICQGSLHQWTAEAAWRYARGRIQETGDEASR